MTAAVSHRYWLAAALSLGSIVAIAFARFAYALVLPAMRIDLGLTYAQAGMLNTANALGYLAGALLCAGYVSRLGNRRLFRVALIVTVLALAGSGLSTLFAAQVALRLLAGASGAIVFICGTMLASNAFSNSAAKSSTAVGVYFGASGAGIVLSGAGLPWLLDAAGDDAWRVAWLAVAGASALFAVIAIRAAHRVEEPSSSARRTPWPVAAFTPALGCYFLFGAGYIGYMTFVVAWMVSHGASAVDVSLTWGTLGAATMASPLAWRGARARWPASKTLAASLIVVATGAAMPLLGTSLAVMIVSAVLFGGAMFIVPAGVTDLVKSSLPKSAWAPAMSVFTVAFAVGQSIGPLLSGWLVDATHSFAASLGVSVAILLAGSACATSQRETDPQRRETGLLPAE